MERSEAASLLRAARAGGYALGAFNAVNLETAQAVVEAAACERAPIILQLSENAARYASLEALLAIGRLLKGAAGVLVVLHFDHAESPKSALTALEPLPDERVRVVKYCRKHASEYWLTDPHKAGRTCARQQLELSKSFASVFGS